MIIKTIPQLKAGNILRQTMLTAITDAAFMTNEYLLQGYADGILSGCTLTTTQDAIIVNEGAVFLDGQIFLIKEPLAINYSPTNTTIVLKMCFADQARDADCVYREMDLVLTGETKRGKGEIELCRFKLQEGAILRYNYRNFEDRSTEFDTMNRVHVPYASYERSTLSPEITKTFAREMLDIGKLPDFDAAFCLQILGSERPVTIEALIRYIEHSNKRKLEDTTNIGIYKELVDILNSHKDGNGPVQTGKQKKWRMMME